MTVYFAVIPGTPPGRRPNLGCGWAAWWSRDPRRDPGGQPDTVGVAPTEEDVPAIVRGVLELTLGRALRLVPVDIPLEWAPRPPRPSRARRARNRPRQPEPPQAAPEWARLLGLRLPCTVDDARRAFRARAKKAHPDGGGTHEGFLALGAAFAEATRVLEGTPGSR